MTEGRIHNVCDLFLCHLPRRSGLADRRGEWLRTWVWYAQWVWVCTVDGTMTG